MRKLNIDTAAIEAARREFESSPAHRAYLAKIMQSLREGIPVGRAYDSYIAEAAAANRAARVAIGNAHGVFLN